MTKVIVNIFEPSYLIAQGLKSLLNGFNNFDIETRVRGVEDVEDVLKTKEFVIIILNVKFYNNLIIGLKNIIDTSKKKIVFGLRTDNFNFENSIFDNYIDFNENKINIEEKILNVLEKDENLKSNKKNDNKLSKREKSILKLLAKGFTNKDIALKLFISIHTVTTHRKNIIKKLDIRTLSGLTVYAILHKIVNMNELK